MGSGPGPGLGSGPGRDHNLGCGSSRDHNLGCGTGFVQTLCTRPVFGLAFSWLAMALCAASLTPGVAHANPPLLMESHSAPPGKNARRLLGVVVDALGERVQGGRALLAKLDGLYGRPSRPLPPQEQARILEMLKTATQQVHAGQWAQAATLLEGLVVRLGADVQSVSHQVHLFQALQEARTLLCICLLRMQETRRAWLVMEDLLRSQPRAAISTVLYGPMLQRLYYQVHSQLELAKGTLTITSSPPGALIFLSGRAAGFTPVDVRELYQGTYDVLLMREGRPSRIKRVALGYPRARVQFDLDTEEALRTEGRAAMVLAESPERRAREFGLARLVAAQVGARRIVLLGVRRLGQREVLLGQILDVSGGRRIAVAYVPLSPSSPSRETLGHLARFLVQGGNPGEGVHVAGDPDGPLGGGARSSPHARARRFDAGHPMSGLATSGWTLLSVGLAGSLGGATALGLDGRTYRETELASQVYRTGRLGYGLLGAGLGLAATGAVLLVWDALRQRSSRVSELGDLGVPGGQGYQAARIVPAGSTAPAIHGVPADDAGTCTAGRSHECDAEPACADCDLRSRVKAQSGAASVLLAPYFSPARQGAVLGVTGRF